MTSDSSKHIPPADGGGLLFAFVLPPGGQTAPDVPLGLVFLQHGAHLTGQGRVDAGQTLPEVLMYGRNKKERFLLAVL